MKRLEARRAAIGIALLLLLTLPAWVGNAYYINVASQILLYAVLALALNVLVGYGGLVSLGHAGLFGVSAYAAGYILQLGYGHPVAILVALVIGVLSMAIFAMLSLRSTGIGFIMITLALGQILWGLAYRWSGVTGGDNGISGLTRPSPFGLDLGNANTFYFFTLLVFVLVWGCMAIWVRSPFGASIRGTKDQPRRMSTLGYNVWLIRWITFIVSGFFGAVAGLMYVYYHQFISPHSLSLANSAEMLLMVIAGGAGTLSGPMVGAALVVLLKNVASAYIDRWVTLLGLVFIFIVMFVPGGIVAGLGRLKQWSKRA
jgi:branched-chain amino acid transport system permease protein